MSSISISINFCEKVCVQIPSSSCQASTYTFVNYTPSVLNIVSGTNSIIISGIFGATGTGLIGINESGVFVYNILVTVTGFSSVIDDFVYCALSSLTDTRVSISGLQIVPNINNPNYVFFVSTQLISYTEVPYDITEYYFVPGSMPTIQFYVTSPSSYFYPQVLILNNYPSSNLLNGLPICGTTQQTSTTAQSSLYFTLSNIPCQIGNYLTYVQSSNGYVYSSTGVSINGIDVELGGYSGAVTLSYFIASNNYVNTSATSGLFFTGTASVSFNSLYSEITVPNFPVGYQAYEYLWFAQFNSVTPEVYIIGTLPGANSTLGIFFSQTLPISATVSLFAFIPSANIPFTSTSF
jgi:hypothetical protein